MTRTAGLAALVAALVLALAGPARADTIAVNDTADTPGASCPDDCTLRAALGAANAGDTIQLGAQTYTLTQGAPLTFGVNAEIAGAGTGSTVIDATNNGGYRAMKVTAAATAEITGLSLTGGQDQHDEAFTSCSPCSTLSAKGGGAIYNQGTLTLDHVALHDNFVGVPVGGAVSSEGTLHLADVSFTNNSAGLGGALFVRSGAVDGTGVTFEDNGSGSFGGGAALLYGGSLSLENSTITGNGWASTRGGGIANYNGTLTLRNDTLAGDARGSLMNIAGADVVENTIMGAGFSDGVDGSCVASGRANALSDQPTGNAITDDQGHNVDEDGSCGLTDPTDITGDAHLASIADNGGPTRTLALLDGSPAIGAANALHCPPVDQRGVSRSVCDIGAFEAASGAPAPSTATTDTPATDITASGATLHGTINVAGDPGAYGFEYGPASDVLDRATALTGVGALSSDTAESAAVDGLRPGTTYFYRVRAENSAGSRAGAVESFTTAPGPPQIDDVTVASTSSHGATITFTVDPAGADTQVHVDYGTSSAYGTSSLDVDAGTSGGPHAKTVTLDGLAPSRTYHFQVVASNTEGTVQNGDWTFRTAVASAPPPGPTPTPTASPQPTPTPTPTPHPDVTAPRLSGLGASAGMVTVRVSEPATIRGTVARCRTQHRKRVCHTVAKLRGRGAGMVRLSVPKKVGRGRYRVTLRATDAAGNRSRPLVRTIRLRH